MIREHHREGRQAIKEYTKYSDRVAILSPAYTKAWKDEVVLDHHKQLKASSKEDSLVLFFNPYQHPTMGCRKLGTSYIRIISRQ